MMVWDKITHLFQIPLSWFREIDRRSNIITDGKILRVDRNNPDGTVLSIDPDAIPSGGTADLSDTTPATPHTAYDASGTAQTASPGTATKASRADHVHLLPDTLVTTHGGQTITGLKIFDEGCLAAKCTEAHVNSTDFLTFFNFLKHGTASSPFSMQSKLSGAFRFLANVTGYSFVLELDTDGLHVWHSDAGKTISAAHIGWGYIEMYGATPFIDFHFGNSSADHTSRIIEIASGALQLVCPNHAWLSAQPSTTDDTSTLEIATLGWVNNKFLPKPSTSFTGSMNVILDVRWNDQNNGKLTKIYRQLNFTNGLLTSIGQELSADIDTPVAYNP